ncbi:carbamoyltransferase HypF, partial [Candidatus Poribacteria bacterium]|nr:carbamoyltransferase HypF [Candidatus Poribacteria bacterium]
MRGGSTLSAASDPWTSRTAPPDVWTATIRIEGIVQGVGFRPFVYRLAARFGVSGWVRNDTQGVTVHAVGSPTALDAFEGALRTDAPPAARVTAIRRIGMEPGGVVGSFAIHDSERAESPTAFISPDLALCDDCQREMRDPTNRRYRYPFINCTNCGPRYSIVESLPYDRPNTTMKAFDMCPLCRAEYDDPLDRRFHAQPNACPDCGPHLEWWNRNGVRLAGRGDALDAALDAIRAGMIVAVKGLGGFHLIVDARDDEAVRRLRARKHREEKPLAVMASSLDGARSLCEVSDDEARLLKSSAAPIVQMRRQSDAPVALSVAPGNPDLGVMLPYTPLHRLLMDGLRFPVVATSGNLSDEPICTDEREAVARLGAKGIADAFLVHNRPIARHMDDSVARVVLDRTTVLRSARGYAPSSLTLRRPVPPLLAVGGHLKNTVAVASGGKAFLSQHIGDLETDEAIRAFHDVKNDLRRLYDVEPVAIATDAHPDYRSTRDADAMGLPTIRVQHHVAHALACIAEHGIEGPVLAVSWDGTGYGFDGTVWGGEFFRIDPDDPADVRVAHLRTFPLPGGDRAVREPRRSALGVAFALYGDELWTRGDLGFLTAFRSEERAVLRSMLARGLRTPTTSSAGRLFDAVASFCGIRHVTRYEGQAAMELEYALDGVDDDAAYDMPLRDGSEPLVLDWDPGVHRLLDDLRAGVPVGVVSARFHNGLARGIADVARRVGETQVVLTGGCFQNRALTERVVALLRSEGFEPYGHERVPPNDGGVALGQIAA